MYALPAQEPPQLYMTIVGGRSLRSLRQWWVENRKDGGKQTYKEFMTWMNARKYEGRGEQ